MESSGRYNDIDTEYSAGHHQLQDSRKEVFDEDCEDNDYFNHFCRSCISDVPDRYYTGQRLLAAIYSGALLGLGMVLFYMRGSSSGGADFLTMTIKKKRPHMSLGRLTLLIDLIIILIGWPVFGDVDSVLYGLIAVFVCSMVIDKILYGIGAGTLAIIVTSKGEETAEEIGRITDRGVTSLEGMGTYTKSKRNVLLCACSKSEAYLVKNAVYQVDDSAFVMFTETSEVLGEGFKESLDEL